MMRIKFAQRILTHLFNRSSLTTALPPLPWPDCFSVINRKRRGEMSHTLPLRTSNCQALPTAYSNCPNCWTLPAPHRAKSTITRHEIPPVSTMKSSIPLPNTFHISPVCCSVPCCFSPEQKQPPHPVFPLPINLWVKFVVQCGFVVFLDSQLPGHLSIQAVLFTERLSCWSVCYFVLGQADNIYSQWGQGSETGTQAALYVLLGYWPNGFSVPC